MQKVGGEGAAAILQGRRDGGWASVEAKEVCEVVGSEYILRVV